MLAQDLILHMDMIDSLQRGIAEIFYAAPQGVLLYNTAGDCYMMSANDETTAAEMIVQLKDVGVVTAHQDFYIEQLQRKFKLEYSMPCWQAVYLSQQPLSMSNAAITIQQLDESHLPLIVKHYQLNVEEGYIKDRIQAGMFGAYFEGELAGFAGTHGEGAMGLLVVLPEFRRRGIARVLESYLINHILQQGFTPYAQILVTNTASIALQKSLKLSLSDKVVTWLY